MCPNYLKGITSKLWGIFSSITYGLFSRLGGTTTSFPKAVINLSKEYKMSHIWKRYLSHAIAASSLLFIFNISTNASSRVFNPSCPVCSSSVIEIRHFMPLASISINLSTIKSDHTQKR